MLLGSDEAKGRVSEGELAERYYLSVRSVERNRKRFLEEDTNRGAKAVVKGNFMHAVAYFAGSGFWRFAATWQQKSY